MRAHTRMREVIALRRVRVVAAGRGQRRSVMRGSRRRASKGPPPAARFLARAAFFPFMTLTERLRTPPEPRCLATRASWLPPVHADGLQHRHIRFLTAGTLDGQTSYVHQRRSGDIYGDA